MCKLLNIFSSRYFLLSIVVSSFLHSSIAIARDYIEDETTTPKSVENIDDPITYGLEKKEERLLKLKHFIKDLPPFLRDAYLRPRMRTYFFNRNTESETDPEAITLGGELQFLSGKFKDTFEIGASYYFSHGIHEDDGDQTLLLDEDGNDLSTLGNLYAAAYYKDSFLRLFRQSFNLPYVNKQDNRMIPVTHEAYILAKDGKTIDFIVGHVSQLKQRNAEGFISMAEAAGAVGSGKGMQMAGARYHLEDNSSIGAINYYTEDTLNIFYSELNFTKELSDEITTRVSAQFSHQKSIGDELIGEFDTNNYGVQFQSDYRNAILTLAATNTGSGAAIRSPFGGRPGFLSLMLLDFDRANEIGFLTGLSYDLSNWGFPSVSGFAKFAWGHNAEDASTGQSLPDASEYNVTLDFKPKTGLLNGAWLRLRHARADFVGGGFTEDTRIILNYELPLKK